MLRQIKGLGQNGKQYTQGAFVCFVSRQGTFKWKTILQSIEANPIQYLNIVRAAS